jgi:hypothetical protein
MAVASMRSPADHSCTSQPSEIVARGPTALPPVARRVLADKPASKVEEMQLGPVKDRFWISIKGPLKHQATRCGGFAS